MRSNGRGFGRGMAMLAAGCLMALAGAATAAEVRQQTLSPTMHAPKARGRAKLALKSPSSGRLKIAAQRLAPNASFDVVADGVKVATLRTNAGGAGKARLSTRPHGRDALLGFDPRGASLAVRNGDGDDVLEGEMSDDGDPNAVACCLPDDDGTECEDRTADECVARGGTVAATASCLPDPCGTPPGGDGKVICCLTDSAEGAFVDDDPEVECEDRTSAECVAAGGTVVQATSCEPNPCAPVPPAHVVVCCVAEEDEDGEVECELRTPEHCAAHQGTVSTATSCDPNPCGGTTSGGDDGEHGDGEDHDGPDAGDEGGSHD